MKLVYIGPSFEESGGVVPLPEGWTTEAHNERDPEVAKAKIASGKYRKEEPAKSAPTSDAKEATT